MMDKKVTKKNASKIDSYLIGYRDGFNRGWEGVLDHLCKLPWDKAMKELELCLKERMESNANR